MTIFWLNDSSNTIFRFFFFSFLERMHLKKKKEILSMNIFT